MRPQKRKSTEGSGGPRNKRRVDEYMVLKIDNSVIKGYHTYKIVPPLDIELVLAPEYTNIHDKDAVLVWMPDTVEETLLNELTSQGIQIRELVEPVPLIIGHVPRGLASVFNELLSRDITISCVATGKPVQSFPPWPNPSQKGGGVVIPCCYNINITASQMGDVIAQLKNVFKTIPGGEAMKLCIS